MHTFVLTDWTTVRGGTGGATITQSESEWLDLTQYEDVIFWIDVREVAGPPVTLNIQTSPTKDDNFFNAANIYQNTGLAAGTFTAASTPTTKVLMSSATIPLARYVRWQLTSGSATFDATFRIMVSANAPGM